MSVGARANGAISIDVRDQGPGIPKSERDRIFERFYRADESRSGDGGSGLGLSIVRWIVDLHDGSIAIEDEQPTGCRVTVTLPKASP